MPRVPSADYSPIEAANQARANARKIGYYAADASNWKQKHDRNVKSMELQSKSLDIQAEGLEFNKWMNEKESKIESKRGKLMADAKTAEKNRLVAETKVKEERAAAIAEKKAAAEAAAREAAEVAAAAGLTK